MWGGKIILHFYSIQRLKFDFFNICDRTLVAILENFQNSDGTVEIPSVLQPYMNGVTKLEPARK